MSRPPFSDRNGRDLRYDIPDPLGLELTEYIRQLEEARRRIRAIYTGVDVQAAPYTRAMEIMWETTFFLYTRRRESFILATHRENVLDTDMPDLIRLANRYIRTLNFLVALSAADRTPVNAWNALSTQDRRRVQAVYNEFVPLLDLLLEARRSGGGAPVPSAAALQALYARLRRNTR
jgi:hypothetical protein